MVLHVRSSCRIVCAAALLLLPCLLPAQEITLAELEAAGGVTASATTNDEGPLGIIPVQHGFNASLTTSSQHDSSSGWSSVFNPDVAFRFTRYLSVDASVPIYAYVSTYGNVGTKAKPAYAYAPQSGVVGDTSLAAHVDFDFGEFSYNGAVSLGMPSGNTTYGLGAGQVTFNLNNHFERSVWIFSPDIELGYGDTSSLVDQRIRKDYISVGPLAHFQAGASIALPRGASFEADAYEQLPLSQDLVYSTTTKGKKKVTTATNVGPAEDNGFLTSLDIPLSGHVTLSGFYSRSLRDHDDTGGFSFAFLLKAPPRAAALLH